MLSATRGSAHKLQYERKVVVVVVVVEVVVVVVVLVVVVAVPLMVGRPSSVKHLADTRWFLSDEESQGVVAAIS